MKGRKRKKSIPEPSFTSLSNGGGRDTETLDSGLDIYWVGFKVKRGQMLNCRL